MSRIGKQPIVIPAGVTVTDVSLIEPHASDTKESNHSDKCHLSNCMILHLQ